MTPIPNEWFHARGGLARDGWESVVDGAIDGWRHTGLRVAELGAGEEIALPAGDVERIIVPLAGSFTVRAAGSPVPTTLAGRTDVFHGPADVLYLGAGTAADVAVADAVGADGDGRYRFAVAEAPASERRPAVHLAAADVPVEIRGTGRDTRQVHNFGTPGVLDAVSLIVCEVITPAGNWSSHPAHKHDEHIPGRESRLEEIYYFESAPARQLAEQGVTGAGATGAFGTFATYSSPAGEIDTATIVRTGDVALVPYGYHGPAAAPPEYDLYYLNVMAGPGPERAWLISDDPAQSWVRDTWPLYAPDPRLPYTEARTTGRLR